MKNVFFALSLIGLFMICSCQKDEINENTNGTLENDSSEIVVTPDTSGKSLVFGIQPGLYGQKNVNAFENVTYSYVGYPNALAQVPASKRRYRIHFQAKNPAKPEVEWDHQATFEVSSGQYKCIISQYIYPMENYIYHVS